MKWTPGDFPGYWFSQILNTDVYCIIQINESGKFIAGACKGKEIIRYSTLFDNLECAKNFCKTKQEYIQYCLIKPNYLGYSAIHDSTLQKK